MKIDWKIFDRLKEIREEKERLRNEKNLLRNRADRIEDLLKTMHRVGKVELPIPNLFAHTQMDKYFNGMEKIDLANEKHVGAIIWFLKNQDNVEIASFSKDEIDKRIHSQMIDIPLDQLQDYIICIEEIFLAIKKKSIRSEKQVLEQALSILEDRKKDPGAR